MRRADAGPGATDAPRHRRGRRPFFLNGSRRATLALLTLAAALVLSLWLWNRPAPPRLAAPGEARPALWQVERGATRFWLFGTMHLLPEGARWMTPEMQAVIRSSDGLVLEAATLDDRAHSRAIFERLGRAERPVAVLSRIPAKDRAAFQQALAQADLTPAMLAPYESWAAAILLSARLLPPGGEGVEPALIALYRRAGKPIGGLETVEQQFGYLDRMPPAAQDAFLAASAAEAAGAPALFQTLYRAWKMGDLVTLERSFADDMGRTPELRAPLLADRNRAWAAEIERTATREQAPLIAVGAAHLVGPENLIILLENRGYRVRRVQ